MNIQKINKMVEEAKVVAERAEMVYEAEHAAKVARLTPELIAAVVLHRAGMNLAELREAVSPEFFQTFRPATKGAEVIGLNGFFSEMAFKLLGKNNPRISTMFNLALRAQGLPKDLVVEILADTMFQLLGTHDEKHVEVVPQTVAVTEPTPVAAPVEDGFKTTIKEQLDVATKRKIAALKGAETKRNKKNQEAEA